MLFLFTVLWFLILLVFVISFRSLLITLLVLEIITFLLLFVVVTYLSPTFISDFLVLSLFSVFVIEGVIGLAGLIMLVSFSGNDYVSSSSLLNC